MKRLIFILILALCLCGCSAQAETDIVATTKPVYDFTAFLCQGTDLTIGQLITDSVSCLHDYSLSVSQLKKLESCDTVVMSGAGLEAFMADLLSKQEHVIDASSNIQLLDCPEEQTHDHEHDHHETDAHIWLSPVNAKMMAENICKGLTNLYPQYRGIFEANLSDLTKQFDLLTEYANSNLQDLSCRELITFHDGFGYMANAYSLSIAAAMEEESGSEASAKELIELIELVEDHHIPAVFVEANGSTSAAGVIAAETNAVVYTLDTGMSSNYFDAMYHNIDTLKEALE